MGIRCLTKFDFKLDFFLLQQSLSENIGYRFDIDRLFGPPITHNHHTVQTITCNAAAAAADATGC